MRMMSDTGRGITGRRFWVTKRRTEVKKHSFSFLTANRRLCSTRKFPVNTQAIAIRVHASASVMLEVQHLKNSRLDTSKSDIVVPTCNSASCRKGGLKIVNRSSKRKIMWAECYGRGEGSFQSTINSQKERDDREGVLLLFFTDGVRSFSTYVDFW